MGMVVIKGPKSFRLYMLWYEDKTLKVTLSLSLSFLQLDEGNKWTVHADAALQIGSLQSSANNNGGRVFACS